MENIQPRYCRKRRINEDEDNIFDEIQEVPTKCESITKLVIPEHLLKPRSPLRAVQPKVFESTPENCQVAAEPAILTLVKEKKFHYYSKPELDNQDEDMFQYLSDEMILLIFSYLPKKTLMRLCLVNQRFNRIVHTDILWTRLDLAGRNFRPGAIGNIVSRGVVILRLAQSEMSDPLFDTIPANIQWKTYQSKLQFLDLSMSTISVQGLYDLLSKCRKLKKLSLEHVLLDERVCQEIAKNWELESLNLTMAGGLTADGISVMFENLVELKNLNISWTYLDGDAVNALLRKITPNIQRLNVAGCKNTFTDPHLRYLVKRCPELSELDLSDCVELTPRGIEALSDLQNLEYLSISRCYNIDVLGFLSLKKLPKLRFLDVFGLVKEEILEMLVKTFPEIGLNKFAFSSVARPTVGSRRTSIWGLRTRD